MLAKQIFGESDIWRHFYSNANGGFRKGHGGANMVHISHII